MRAKFLLTGTLALFGLSNLALGADMPVKAPPAPTAPSWAGFYAGVQLGGAWSDEAVNYSPNDRLSGFLVNGVFVTQPLANNYRVPQSGVSGGFTAGYNWQRSNWLLGVETDFSFAGLRGRASGSSIFAAPFDLTQTTTSEQGTDWYGTVRGRAGWLATPNLLLFGTGGLAYGRVAESANYVLTGPSTSFPNSSASSGFSFICTASGVPCFAGSSSATKVGWAAGAGVEWLFSSHWSAKIEYQFVDLGSETLRVTANPCPAATCGFASAPSSFNVAFHDRFNVIRVGVNYHFW